MTQGQAYEFESRDRYIWAPKVSRGDKFFWRNVELVKVGDVIIHFAGAINGGISAISQATTDYYDAPIPPELQAVATAGIKGVGFWKSEGRCVNCDYVTLSNKMPIKKFKETISNYKRGPGQHSAFNKNDGVNQGYLYELEGPIAYVMIKEAVRLNPYLQEHQFIVDILKTLLTFCKTLERN